MTEQQTDLGAVIKALENVVYSDVPPQTKVLLLVLSLDGTAMTAEQLSSKAGLTPHQVHHWLKQPVEVGVVTLDEQPNFESKRFERTYKISDDKPIEPEPEE